MTTADPTPAPTLQQEHEALQAWAEKARGDLELLGKVILSHRRYVILSQEELLRASILLNELLPPKGNTS